MCTELYNNVTVNDENSIIKVNDPLACVIRLKELLCPIGYVDTEKLKNRICEFIDDTAIINFS